MSIVSKFLEAIKSFSQKTESPAKPTYGIPTVKFDPSTVTETVRADIRKNVRLIEEIDQKHFDQVYDVVVRSVSVGRDLYTLSKELHERYGITKRRAAEIARFLNNEASAVMNRERQESLGIKYALWIHSGVLCENPKNPQQSASHLAANGKRYDVSKGMFLDGKWTWPGYEDGCRCISRSIIPGFV